MYSTVRKRVKERYQIFSKLSFLCLILHLGTKERVGGRNKQAAADIDFVLTLQIFEHVCLQQNVTSNIAG